MISLIWEVIQSCPIDNLLSISIFSCASLGDAFREVLEEVAVLEQMDWILLQLQPQH